MRDEHDRGVDLVLEVAEQVEDLRLDRHVEGRGGLVGDDDLGVAGERHGDHDALAHAAGELVREHLGDALGVRDADHLDRLDGALADLGLGLALAVMQGDDLVDLVADAEDRVERRHGLLEDHRDHVAAQVLHVVAVDLGDVVGLVAEVQADLAGDDLALRTLQKLHERERRDRLAAAGLAHDAHDLPLRDLEAHAVD